MAIKVKEVPIKAHNSIKKVERYYVPLRRAYKIISLKLKGISEELTLQMAIKAIEICIKMRYKRHNVKRRKR